MKEIIIGAAIWAFLVFTARAFKSGRQLVSGLENLALTLIAFGLFIGMTYITGSLVLVLASIK